MSLKRFVQILIVILLTAAITYAARALLIEPRTLHERCVLQAASALCMARQVVIMGFVLNVYSIASIVLGLMGLVLRRREYAWGGVVLGVIGALLYRIEFAALGLLCGALALARPPVSPEHRQSDQ
ncbi:MAG: hypothetical protein ABW110_16030 [Steroidobacteraceae bacterium]